MRSLLLLGVGATLLAFSFRSCSWTNTESTDIPDAATATKRPSQPLPVRRPFPQGPNKPNAYPMASLEGRQVVTAALASLPKLSATRSEVRQNPHSAPPSLLNAAEAMGEMVDRANRGGEDAETAGQFFAACAADPESPSAVRAVCLRHYWDLKGNAVSLNDQLPERIKKIAAHLSSSTR